MISLVHLIADLPDLCRNLLQVGIGLVLQSTVVLLAGLLAGRRLRRRGPAAAALVYRATVLAAILGALLALAIGGRFQPRWAIALPPAEEAANRAPAGREPEGRRWGGFGDPGPGAHRAAGPHREGVAGGGRGGGPSASPLNRNADSRRGDREAPAPIATKQLTSPRNPVQGRRVFPRAARPQTSTAFHSSPAEKEIPP